MGTINPIVKLYIENFTREENLAFAGIIYTCGVR